MLIRYGYDITVTCQAPTPMVALLTAHQDRAADVRQAEVLVTTPAVPSTIYVDLFGNHCRRFVAPAGDLALWADGTLEDSGQEDLAFPDAREVPIADLPDECLIYLIGSRYCETDKLSQIAWDLFGNTPPGWGRVQAICDFVNGHIRFGYMDARSTRTAAEAYQERIGVCRDYAHLAVAFCRCLNIPARYVNGYLGDIGVPIVDPMDFSAWMEVYLGDDLRSAQQQTTDRPHRGSARSRRGRRAADQLIRAACPEIVPRLGLRHHRYRRRRVTPPRSGRDGVRGAVPRRRRRRPQSVQELMIWAQAFATMRSPLLLPGMVAQPCWTTRSARVQDDAAFNAATRSAFIGSRLA
jgi:transglutaminase-like putative cysteine protease